jgi:hypothetical protein
MVRTKQQQMVRRIVGYSFLTDVIASGAVFFLFSHFIGSVLFVIGLFLTGLTYANLRQVLRVRGVR